MKTEKEIREYLNKLINRKRIAIDDFSYEEEIIEIDAMISVLRWVLSEWK